MAKLQYSLDIKIHSTKQGPNINPTQTINILFKPITTAQNKVPTLTPHTINIVFTLRATAQNKVPTLTPHTINIVSTPRATAQNKVPPLTLAH